MTVQPKSSPARRGHRLAVTLAIAFAVLSILSVVAVTSFLIVLNFQAQQEAIASQQENIALGAAQEVSNFVERAFGALESTSQTGNPLSGTYQDQQQLLGNLLGLQPAFREVSLADAHGQELAKLSRLSVITPDDLSNQAGSDWFAQVSQNERYISPVYIDETTNEPLVAVAVPIKDGLGEFEGALIAEVNLKFMWDLVASLRIGEEGLAYVVDREGNLIAFGDTSRVLRGENLSHLGEVVEFIKSEGPVDQAAGVLSVGINGTNVLATYKALGTPDWAVMVELPVSEGYREAFRNVGLASAVSLFVAALAAVAGVFVARRLAEPLLNLTATATQIAEGETELTAEIEGPAEVVSLATAFNSMTEQLRELIGSLEKRVADRTRELEQRAVQLETAANVGRAAASILELDVLTRRVVELVQEGFDFYYAGLFLLDQAGQYAVLEAGTGEAGRIMKEAGHQLEVGGLSMVGTACARGQARIALDVAAMGSGVESVRFDNPLLPDTRSEMALPLMVADRVIGALDVQSTQPAAFSEEDIAVLQLVADQVAVAIDNARKFSEEAGLLEATSPLYRVSRRLATAVTTDEIVQAVIGSVAETEADGCAVGRLDLSSSDEGEAATFLGSWDRHGGSGFPVGVSFDASASPFPLDMAKTFWVVEDVTEDGSAPETFRKFLGRFQGRAFVNVPLLAGRRVIGFVSIYRTAPGPFSPVSLRLYETLVDQAAVALERARLLEETQGRAERERFLGEITTRMRETLDVRAVLQTAADQLYETLGLEKVAIHLAAEENGDSA